MRKESDKEGKKVIKEEGIERMFQCRMKYGRMKEIYEKIK